MAEYNILKLYDSASGRIQQKKCIIRPVAESNKKKYLIRPKLLAESYRYHFYYRPYSTPNVCVKPTPLAANHSVKGCREQPLLFLFAGCGCSPGFQR